MDSVVHFEIPIEDEKRAKQFYEKTFGWIMNDMPELSYTIAMTTEVDDKRMPKQKGMINGGMMKRNKLIKNPIITIGVKDLDKTRNQIIKNGGKIIMEKQEIKGVGFNAYFQDTEGNILGAFQPTGKRHGNVNL